ncbi:MAG: phosphomannomutase [Verrucomicrobiia bacterium]
MKISVGALMSNCGVKFGTSGARGLSEDITDFIAYTYTLGFIAYLESVCEIPKQSNSLSAEDEKKSQLFHQRTIAVAGDLRPSTDRIVEAVCRAIEDANGKPIYCGKIPSPALALYGFKNLIPSIMVTGSHIPADRNGIKFNKPHTELLKSDEEGIRRQVVNVDESLFDSSGFFKEKRQRQRSVNDEAKQLYISRYIDFFEKDIFKSLKIGVYQHSAVGREILVEILRQLGANVTTLGYSEQFVPVDTEAIRETDVQLAQKWAAEFKFDAIVSTDGDSDRPLISDENGNWLKGDIVGLLCARFLGADSVSIPISCNTAIEKSGYFAEVKRTKIGSPYVIESMQEAILKGRKIVVGFEANGGFLLQSKVVGKNGNVLDPLPTRDSVLPILAILCLSKTSGKSISSLLAKLPQRHTASDRLTNFEQSRSRAILEKFSSVDEKKNLSEIENYFGAISGKPAQVNRLDGVRITFENGEIIHLRPSGNAPEFRCYTEADSQTRAIEINRKCLDIIKKNF